MTIITKYAAVFTLAIALAVPVYAADNLLFILDASGSMHGRVDGVTKMNTAKGTLTKLISDLPGGMNVALVAYGHRMKGDCCRHRKGR